MAEPFVHPWDAPGHRSFYHRTPDQAPPQVSRGLPAILALVLAALILLLLGAARPSLAGEPDPADPKVDLQSPLDFENCVRLAIHQSPYFVKSSVEIDIRRMDETDSRFAMVPPLTFRSYYYVNHSSGTFNTKPYSLNFSMDPYNPVGSFFTLQAQKMATQMATLIHLQVITEGLGRLAKMFLNLAGMKRLAVMQGDVVSLARESLTYAENRLSIGTGTSLEVQLAAQELEVAKTEKERLEASRKRVQNSLKSFLGLKPHQSVDFDLRDAQRQVLGSFDPGAASLEQAKARSYEMKALDLKKEMQGYHVSFAKAKVLPSILFTTQTPDPLSVTTSRGLYVGIGLEVPVWDGFKRIRNVSRQKAILKQFESEKDLKEIDMSDKWSALQEDLKIAATALKIAQSQEELSRLKERQGEIRFQSGGEPLPIWLEARKAKLMAQKNAANKALEYDEITLQLRHLSGDLGYSYVDQSSWQK